MTLDYEWQGPYVTAMLETESSKLPQRVEEARAAIQARIHELNQDHHGTP
jgi:hypothetical protein